MNACRTSAWLAGACALYCMVGCGPTPSQPKPDREPVRTVSAGGLLIAWHEPAPDGKVNPVLEIEADSGVVEQGTQSGRLDRARGRIFRAGVLRARFTAPRVQADMAAHRVVAGDRVTIESAAPEGLTLRARHVEWRSDLHRIVATGHVTFVQRDQVTGKVLAEGGPFDRVTINTELQKLTIP